jgi:hypothetical protein
VDISELSIQQSVPTKPARFELLVIEAALSVVCSSFSRKIRSLAPAISSALKGLRSESRGLDVVQAQADELLPLKNKLDELRKRVKEFNRAVNDILINDEDLNMICTLPVDKSAGSSASSTEGVGTSTSAQVAMGLKEETMALEMLFEVYLNEVEWISAEIEEIGDEVTNTEGIFYCIYILFHFCRYVKSFVISSHTIQKMWY